MSYCLAQLTSGLTPEGLLQQLLNGLTLGSIYALIALGYSMVYGVLELINFAHGDVFMVGAFASLGVVNALGVHEGSSPGLVLAVMLLALLVSVVVCSALGYTIERVAYRPLRNAPRLAPLISAIGVSFVLEGWVANFVTDQDLALPNVIAGQWPVYGNVSITNVQLILFATTIVMMFSLQGLVRRTRLGRGMRAVAQDREAAALMGVNINEVISWTFVVGSALAAVAGLLWMFGYSINQSIGFIAGLKAFTAAVIGGIGNIPGAMLGGFALGMAEAFGAAYISNVTCHVFTSSYQNVFTFAFLILILVFRPSGLLRERVSERA
ncbi:MAG: branched-chain amino acid ABC transporter permease [Candidatus Dormibacteria bacterium]